MGSIDAPQNEVPETECTCSAPSLSSPQVSAGVCNAQIQMLKPVLISALTAVGESTFSLCKVRWDNMMRLSLSVLS